MTTRRPPRNRERCFTFLKVDVVRHSELLTSARRATVVELLDRFEAYVDTIIQRHGGDVWSWQGDGGLCAFDAGPARSKVEVAVTAAIEILSGVSPFHLSPEPFTGAKEEIKIRIALHVGMAEIHSKRGRIHSPDINFVAHLEREATPNSVIASGEVLRECPKALRESFVKLEQRFEHRDVWICELHGDRRIKTWEKVLSGVGTLYRKTVDSGFHPDLVIGCGRSAGIVAAVLAGNLGQEAFVVLARKKDIGGDRRIRFDDVAVLNPKSVPKDSRVLVCFYQISTGGTARAFSSYLTREAGFRKEQMRIVSLFLERRGKTYLDRAGIAYDCAFQTSIPWGETPWKLNDRWEWV